MTEDKGKYAPPFSLRLSKEERLRLDADAGSLPLGDYIRTQLFENPTPRKRSFRRPVQDAQALGEVLTALGRSRLSSNLNQLAKAVHSGSLPVSPETEAAILAACATVRDMGGQLVQALGLPDEPPKGGDK
ncbi:MAG: hypothetical protein PSY14_15910 [bacterium]|nr:hypothetical protein [bacterium]